MVRNIKIEPAVKLESKRIAIGVLAMSVIMEIVFVVLGRFDYTVLLGNLLGGGWAILNFFLMALGTSLAADKAENQDVKGGSLLVRNSYMLRLLGLFIVLIICAKTEVFNLIALVLPLVFVRPTLTAVEFFRKKGA